jgi:hypothetical protein
MGSARTPTAYLIVAVILVVLSSRDLSAQSDELQRQARSDSASSNGALALSGLFIEGGMQLPFLSTNSILQYSANTAEYSIETAVNNPTATIWIGGGYRVTGGLDAGVMMIYRAGEATTRDARDSLTDAGVTGWTADLFLSCDILHTLASGNLQGFPLELALGIGAGIGGVKASFPVFPSYMRIPPYYLRQGTIIPTEQNLFGVVFIARSGYHITQSIVADVKIRWGVYPQIEVNYEEVQKRQPNSSEGFGFSMNSRDVFVGVRYLF